MNAEIICTTKDRLTREQAKRIARRMRATRGKAIQAYKCPNCRAWHVGNRPFEQRKEKR
ncbi:MAG: hypothetical protein EpisKO_41440 [Epibacterium sp.]